ncbi:AAA family ATPase [Candidatus Woesearchaeota archaeon]|nr:AAA family ATPase [Candidatus Woesearchaeota archaeon]
MRKICIFNQFNDSNLMLNVFARFARKKKRVLYLDFRKKDESENVFSMLNEDSEIRSFITTLEPNLDFIQGDSKMNLHEFGSYYKIFDLKYFEMLENLDYDIIAIEVDDSLSILANNALFFSNEIIAVADMDNHGVEFVQKLARFTHQYNKLYARNIFISKVIPAFSSKIDKKKHDYLVSEFNSDLISEPVNIKKFKESISGIAMNIMNIGKSYSRLNMKEKQKFIQEYLSMISKN